MSDTPHIHNAPPEETLTPIYLGEHPTVLNEEQRRPSRAGLLGLSKRMSLNASSDSQSLNPRRPSRFKEGNDSPRRSPVSPKQNFSAKNFLRASPALVKAAKKLGRQQTLKASSTKELPNQSLDSRSFSELEGVQHLYHNHVNNKKEPTSNILSDLSPKAGHSKKISMQSQVKQVYYQMLRKKLARSGTQSYPNTAEFTEQIQEIKDNLRTPNAERIRDLVIVDKTSLERLKIYHDKYPLLEFRRNLLRIKRTISLIASKIISHSVFEYFILCVIIANSIILAFDDPTVAGVGPEGVDNLLLAIYTMECVLKILGMGFFFNQGAYLRDLWNVMDFVIVVTAYIPIVLASDGLNLQAFRALRVLRPLRTISNIEALRVLIMTLVGAFGPLLETLFILFFVYLIFAIGGLQLFSGMLKKRCFYIDTGIPMEDDNETSTENQKFCSTDDDCPGAAICGKMVNDPNYDITNFNTLQNSFLMVFQIVTQEGWTDIMYFLDKTFSPYASIYFIILIVICAFFLLNLTLAVLKVKFTENTHEEVKAQNANEKYWVHGEKFFNRMEHNKKEVLHLMERRRKGEIEFNKYEFNHDNLKAIDVDKAHKVKTGVTKKRRRADSLGKLGWLQRSVLSKIKIHHHAKKGFSTLVSIMKRLTFRQSSSIHPESQKGSPNHESAKAFPQIVITPKTKSFRKLDTVKLGNPNDERPDPNSTIKPLLDTNSPLSKDFGSPMRLTDTPRGFITPLKEKSPARGNDSPILQHQNGTPSLVVIPSIAEANEKSEHSLGALGSKNFHRIQRNNFLSSPLKVGSPIRPALGEKVHVRTGSSDKTDGVLLVNIAGIRNKDDKKPKPMTNGTYVFDATPVPRSKEVSFNDEHSVFDLLDAKSPIGMSVTSRKNHSEDRILKKINQITKPTQVKPRKSPLANQPRLSEALTSTFDLDEEGNFDKGVAPTALLDDSDFFDEKQRRDLIRRKRREVTMRRKLNGGRSPTKRTTHNMITSFGHLPGSRIIKGESQTHLGSKKFLKGNAEGSRSWIAPHDEDDDEERFVIDVRYLKAIPAFERDYHPSCENDVLPSKKEREEREEEEKEIERLRQVRLKLEFKITPADERKARERVDSYYTKLSDHATVTASRRSRRSRSEDSMGDMHESRSLYDNKEFETNNSKQTLQRKTSYNSTKKSQNQTSSKQNAKSNALNGGDDDDYIKPEKMNDFVEILTRIEKPFDNEVGLNDHDFQSEKLKDFKLLEEYRAIRRTDLETYKISENNWSGDNVLRNTNANFAVHRVKLALNNQDSDIWRPGYYGVIHGFRRFVRAFCEWSLFSNFIMISVVLNTMILGTEGMISDEKTTSLLSDFNYCFTIIFTIEMGLKLIALGIFGYVNDKMNLFDAAVVVISLVEMIFLTGGSNKAMSAFRTIRLFRTFRVLRVTKLLRSLRYMQLIITIIGRSIKKFIYILALLFLFIFIYTLLGMQLFGGGFNLPDNEGANRTRQNFDTFVSAFMASFQVMTMENWPDILFLAVRSEYVNSIISIFYFISWIWIGNYILLNLFLAILLDEFTGEEISAEYDELEEDDGSTNYSSKGQTFDRSTKVTVQRTLSRDSAGPKSIASSKIDDGLGYDGETTRQTRNHKTEIMICEKSLYILSKQNLLRKLCLRIIQHRYFERMIMTMIVVSSIKLAFDTYYDDTDNPVIAVSNEIDDGINIFFAVEAGLKIISLGLFVDEGCYLRDSWNKLDMVIVIASILDMSIQAVNLSFIRVLRLLRTLRPLRFITHNESMRLIVTALLESVGAILNVVVVMVLIWIMFAILATNIVGSKMGYCSMDSNELYYKININDCASVYGGTWTTPSINFDNIFQGLVSLFVLSTQENWPNIMFTVADANDASEGPIENHSAAFAYIYFVVFLFIGEFFLVNLFIGVIFLEFTRAQKRENHLQKFLTTEQQNWVMMQRLLISIKPDLSNVEPKNRYMKKVFRIINHTKFELFIMSIIVLNILLMALSFEGSSDNYNTVLKYINWCFSVIFFCEMILKHIGFGFRRYWADGWNRFDAFVVLASIFDILTDILQQSFFSFIRIGPQLARVFRVLRVSRLFKLVKQFEGLQKMLNTLVFTLPSLLNVGALLFLVYFIYSVLATYIFKDISGGQVIDGKYIHFQDFFTAIITLFRCSTGENWHLIMFDTVNPQACNPGTYPCGTWAAYPFWLSFIVVCKFIFLNLFILVILQQFEDYHFNDDNPVNTFAVVMENHVKNTWEEFALRHGGTHIHISQLVDFFSKIPAPYGLKGSGMTKIEMSKTVMHLDIPQDHDNMIYYNDIVFAVFRFGFQNKQTEEPNNTQNKYLLMHEEKTITKLNSLKKNTFIPGLRRRASVREMTKTKKNGAANPILRLLFMGMTMKSWVKYTHNTVEKMKAAKENGVEYVESESDEEDYTFMDHDGASEHSDDGRDSISEEEQDDDTSRLNGQIKEEEEEAELDEDAEQHSLINIDSTERKFKKDIHQENDYFFNNDVSPIPSYDEEHNPRYNLANMAMRDKLKRGQINPAKASFLDHDMSPKICESKSSKGYLEDGEKPSVINFNINNNIIINNNYFINGNPASGNSEIAALSPVSRETSTTNERNTNRGGAQPQQAENLED